MKLATSFQRSDSPPWQRRGGRDIKQDAAKPPCVERTGRFVPLPINRWVGRTAPSAPAAEASHLFVSGAATPPWPRRGMCVLKENANYFGQLWSQTGPTDPSSRDVRAGRLNVNGIQRFARGHEQTISFGAAE